MLYGDMEVRLDGKISTFRVDMRSLVLCIKQRWDRKYGHCIWTKPSLTQAALAQC